VPSCIGRKKSTAFVDASRQYHAIEPPTRQQLRIVFMNTAIPMIGFGFMDQTIMLQAGNAIDCTLGVTFGISTLTAAAFGQICSDGAGVLFGRSLEQFVSSMGVPKSGITTAQRTLTVVKRTKLAGNFFGVVLGCTLGLVNLLFLDTSRPINSIKLSSSSTTTGVDDDTLLFHPKFSIEASNSEAQEYTVLRVSGPDVDGLLASTTAALSDFDCSVIELHAKRKDNDDVENENKILIDDVFHVVKRSTGEAFSDDELEELAKSLLNSTTRKAIMNTNNKKNSVESTSS